MNRPISPAEKNSRLPHSRATPTAEWTTTPTAQIAYPTTAWAGLDILHM